MSREARWAVVVAVVAVALWSALGTVRFAARERSAEPERVSRPSPAPVTARTEKVASTHQVLGRLGRAGFHHVLGLDHGAPRRITIETDGSMVRATTVYRMPAGESVAIVQSTRAPSVRRSSLRYVRFLPSTVEDDDAVYWSQRGYYLALTKSGFAYADHLAWWPYRCPDGVRSC
jgi:hypothetical protein